ncbi:MAG: type II secretion system protein [Parcubacteria group bacterium]|nr:type II secretion system protein [Parcubacteria group bacterium]
MPLKSRNKKAFTLIELLVVVAIIGLLSTISVVSLNNARQRARDAKRLADVRQIQAALELYFLDQNGYPDISAALSIGNFCISSTNGASTSCTGTVYMASVPSNPMPRDGSCAAAHDYVYNDANTLASYTLTYCLGTATAGIAAAAHTATPQGIANP